MYPRLRELMAFLASWTALGFGGCLPLGCMSDGGWQAEAGLVFKASLNQIQTPTGNPSRVGFDDALPSFLQALGLIPPDPKPEASTVAPVASNGELEAASSPEDEGGG